MNLQKISKILLGASASVLALIFIVKLINGASPITSGLWLAAAVFLAIMSIALTPDEGKARNSVIGCGIVLVLSLMAFSFVLGQATVPASSEHEANVPAAVPTETPTEAVYSDAPIIDEPTENPEFGDPTDPPEPSGTAYEVSYTNAVVYKNSIGSFWVHVVVQIENTGSDPLYLSSSSIDLEDSKEHLVKTLELVSGYPQVVLPGETGLFVEDTTLDEDPGEETLNVFPHLQVKTATVECIRFETSDEELFTDKYYGVKLKGRVKNTSDEAQSLVYVIANLYDADHHGIGQLMTIVTNDIAAGDKVGFELSALSMPESITEESVASFEVFSFPTQYQFDW